MKRLITSLGVTAPAKLGRCHFCMRSACASALAFWLAAAIADGIDAATLSAALAVLAVALTLLWLAHLTAFAARAAARRRRRTSDTTDKPDRGRRAFFPTFARAFAAAAFVSALPASLAAAAGTMKKCTYTYFCNGPNGEKPCCDASTPYLCHNDCKCYAQVPDACNSYSQCSDNC